MREGGVLGGIDIRHCCDARQQGLDRKGRQGCALEAGVYRVLGTAQEKTPATFYGDNVLHNMVGSVGSHKFRAVSRQDSRRITNRWVPLADLPA